MPEQPSQRVVPGTTPGKRSVRSLSLAMTLTAVALLAVTAGLASLAVPSTEAVRVRNSMIATVGTDADFDWRPPDVPPGFLQQRGEAPDLFRQTVAAVAPEGSAFERTVALVRDLDSGPEHGGPIQSSTLATFRTIKAKGQGYCADYTQVLNGLAWAAGIPVREWGLSFDGFGGWGHAFNEVYDQGLRKWVMVDPFYAFWVRDSATGVPLSAIEFRDRLRLPDPLQSMQVVRLVPAAYDWTSDEKMLGFYRRGVDQFYLWWGNNVFDYDDQPLVRAVGPLSRSLEQLAAMLTGVHPGIRILPTAGNAEMIQGLRRTRGEVLVLMALCTALFLLLMLEWRLRRRAVRAAGER